MDKKIKKKTLELFTKCFMAFLFLSSWVVLGVALALKQADVNVGGNVSFKATAVYAKLSGTIKDSNGIKNLEEIEINSRTTNNKIEDVWSNFNLTFGDDPIEIIIQIENLAEDRGLYVTFADNIIKRENSENDGDSGDDELKVFHSKKESKSESYTPVNELDNLEITSKGTQTGTQTLKIELDVRDRNKSIKNKSFNLDITLSKDEIKESTDYTNFEFSLIEDENNKVSITKKSESNVSGDLKIPAQVKYNGVICDVTKIEKNAFSQSLTITSLVIPSTVTEIGASAFFGCSQLETISGLNGVKSLGDSVFRNCTSLTKVIIPSSVKTWGTMVFRGCTSLNTVLIQEGVDKIGTSAFHGCTALTSIVIPESVKEIGAKAFYVSDKSGLTSAIFKNPNGWSAGDKDFSGGELADASTNATYLKSDYAGKIWTKTRENNWDQ